MGDMRFTVLGPVRAWRGEAEVPLGAPQQRALLTLLLASGGRPLSVAELVDAIWGAEPPNTAVNVIHQYVGALRRLLEPGLRPRDQGRWMLASAGGYRVDVTAESLDLLEFRDLVGKEDYAAALSLWQGPVAAGLAPGLRESPLLTALDREWAAAARAGADHALAAGTAADVLSGVRRTADLFPFDEALQARLILLLGAAGQQAEALDRYRATADLLREELGLDPGEELTAARDAVLRGTPTREDRPAQLPADLATFAGRTAHADAPPPETGTVMVINGMAGVGKTTLAVHWAHRIAHHYPDGQLYLNLRGYNPDDNVLEPAQALRTFLGALGVASGDLPSGQDALGALFRTRMAERRMLVVLDNARDADQVRPLLPATSRCLVVVTSRNRMDGLIAAESARPLSLDVLSSSESRDLLVRRLGASRVDGEPEAAEEIISRCGRLPLTLAIVAARAAVNPTFSLRAIAAELADGELDALDEIRAVFSWSYRALGEGAGRLFRLLAVHPGPDVSVAVSASLAGIAPRDARQWLAELARASLLIEHQPGRFQCHDLLRAYAAELPGEPSERVAARHRMLDHYLHSGLLAHDLLSPARRPIAIIAMSDGVTPETIADARRAVAWFETETAVLFAVIDLAARLRLDQHAWQLQWVFYPYMVRRLPTEPVLTVMRAAAEALDRLGDVRARTRHQSTMAVVHLRNGQLDIAEELQLAALRTYQEIGDLEAQAEVHQGLANVADRRDDHLGTLRHSRRALEMCRRLVDRDGEARSLGGIAWAYSRLGHHRRAIDRARSALTLLADSNDHVNAAGLWHTVGHSHVSLDEYGEGTVALHRAIELAALAGDQLIAGVALTDLGEAQLGSGDPEAARRSWARAAEVLEEVDSRRAAELRARLEP